MKKFQGALKAGEADFKKCGRILKILLFGSYARGTFVDEPWLVQPAHDLISRVEAAGVACLASIQPIEGRRIYSESAYASCCRLKTSYVKSQPRHGAPI